MKLIGRISLAQLPPTSPFHSQSAFFPPPPLPPPPSMPMPSHLSSLIPPPPFMPPPSFPMPPPELLSKMFQTPPPPLPVPPPPAPSVNTTSSNTVNDADLYDPLKVDDEDEEEPSKEVPLTPPKPIRCAFNIKKEHTIKIEPSRSAVPCAMAILSWPSLDPSISTTANRK